VSGEITQGRRLPDATLGESGLGWDEWRNGAAAPGSYMRVSRDWDGQSYPPHWYIVDPAGAPGTLVTHAITEHDDGTITVSPSILDSRPAGWHGWLERGVWRSC
jgi:hypothetical protein